MNLKDSQARKRTKRQLNKEVKISFVIEVLRGCIFLGNKASKLRVFNLKTVR